ncbi:pyridoxal phosphate-dependent transferase [Lipomyces oligophaga]|uniref:pyridoxal phosphate-dependent transferase n=1 Tax=Lipomyces oligophaga TaxID=45792 RepID=UPI0034CD49A9
MASALLRRASFAPVRPASALFLRSRVQHLQLASISSSAILRSSFWKDVPLGPPDAILGITEAFKADEFAEKINLGVGAYRDDNGKPWVLPSVREAELRVVSKKLDKEYAGITGVPAFTKLASELSLSPSSPAITEGRLAITQSISGTGALRIGGEFLDRWYPHSKEIYIPNPSWANHKVLFTDSGLTVKQYRYYDNKNIALDLDGLLADLQSIPDKSMVLLHACAHNPTGVDPTPEEWAKIADVMRSKGHFPFFDMAYQGFASGDADRDAFAVRFFIEQGFEIALAQSFAKNMGLYGERVGTFSIVSETPEISKAVESQIKIVVRPLYSNPPVHGARVAAEILGDADLRAQWLEEVKTMADRIISMRSLLKSNLEQLGSQLNWSHITSQIGMFCYTGLSPQQVDTLRSDYSVYLTRDGRISVAGVTTKNVQRLAESIHAVTK